MRNLLLTIVLITTLLVTAIEPKSACAVSIPACCIKACAQSLAYTIKNECCMCGEMPNDKTGSSTFTINSNNEPIVLVRCNISSLDNIVSLQAYSRVTIANNDRLKPTKLYMLNRHLLF